MVPLITHLCNKLGLNVGQTYDVMEVFEKLITLIVEALKFQVSGMGRYLLTFSLFCISVKMLNNYLFTKNFLLACNDMQISMHKKEAV